MSYQFIDAYASVLTADSSFVSGSTQRPVVNVGSVLTIVPIAFTGNASVSGTVGVTGSVGVTGTPSISGTVLIGAAPSIYGNISGSVVAFQGGTQITSVMGGPIGLLAPTASFISGVTSVMTGTGLTSVLSAAGGSIKNYVTHIMCSNGAAVGTFVDVKDGGGNVLYSGFAAASGGGFSSHIYPPLVGSANKSIDAQPRVQASIIVAMTGYTA